MALKWSERRIRSRGERLDNILILRTHRSEVYDRRQGRRITIRMSICCTALVYRRLSFSLGITCVNGAELPLRLRFFRELSARSLGSSRKTRHSFLFYYRSQPCSGEAARLCAGDSLCLPSSVSPHCLSLSFRGILCPTCQPRSKREQKIEEPGRRQSNRTRGERTRGLPLEVKTNNQSQPTPCRHLPAVAFLTLARAACPESLGCLARDTTRRGPLVAFLNSFNHA